MINTCLPFQLSKPFYFLPWKGVYPSLLLVLRGGFPAFQVSSLERPSTGLVNRGFPAFQLVIYEVDKPPLESGGFLTYLGRYCPDRFRVITLNKWVLLKDYAVRSAKPAVFLQIYDFVMGQIDE